MTRVAYHDGSPYPGNAALGAVDDMSLTRAVYHAIGADLAGLGINFNLAPCADVLGAADSPAVGTRSFGTDTDLVSRHTAAAVTGLQAAGVAACTKHFPGHGRTGTDTHEAIATIEGGLAELRQRDLPPFAAAIRAGTVAIMPSHLRVPELTGDLPATVSSAALADLLRGELGFTGIIVSDALEMRATRDMFGVPQAAVLAVAAGTDLLCLGRDSDQEEYLAVREALVAAVRDGTITRDAAGGSSGPGCAPARGPGAHPVPGVRRRRSGAGRAGRRGWTAWGSPRPGARFGCRGRGPRSAAADHRGRAAGRTSRPALRVGLGPWAPAGSVPRRRRQAIGAGAGRRDRCRRRGPVPATAGGGFRPRGLRRRGGRSLVAVVRDAHRDAGTRSLVSALLAARPDMVLVEMGLPLWQPPEGTSYLATYGASRASAQAAAELLGLVQGGPPAS